MRLSGSSARLIVRITSSAGPCSASRYFILPYADAVLAGAGAAHGERAQHQPFVQAPRFLELGRLVRIEDVEQMEVAVAGVADERRSGNGAPALSAFVSTMHSARREIGTQTSVVHARAPGPQRQRRVQRVVARPPQPLAILEPRRPLESRGRRARPRAPAPSARLIGDVALAVAVKLEEQRRRHRVARLRVPVDRVHLHLVEQLDPRDRNAELDRRDDGVDGALHRRRTRRRRPTPLPAPDAAAR